MTVSCMLTGCGLVLQGRTSQISVDSDPSGATLTVKGRTYMAPAVITVPRVRGGVVLRASKTGYQDSCRIVDLTTTTRLVAFDSIPLALGLLVDKLAGTWPGEFPERATVPLDSADEEQHNPLPSDEQLLRTWREVRQDPCVRRRAAPPPPVAYEERWVATYHPALVAVKVQGKALTAIERQDGDDHNVFAFRDDALAVTLNPNRETIALRVENRLVRSVKVLWEDAVFVDFDDISNPISRQKRAGTGTQGASVIAPGTAVEETVFPSSRVYEASRTVRTADQECLQSCGQLAYQCMAGHNCSGNRSKTYIGRNAFVAIVADAIDADLCQRRCIDQGRACASSCARTHQESEGIRHLPIVPDLLRGCSQPEDEFTEAAEESDPETYAVLLPVEIAGSVREYLLEFEGEVFEYQLNFGCPHN